MKIHRIYFLERIKVNLNFEAKRILFRLVLGCRAEGILCISIRVVMGIPFVIDLLKCNSQAVRRHSLRQIQKQTFRLVHVFQTSATLMLYMIVGCVIKISYRLDIWKILYL